MTISTKIKLKSTFNKSIILPGLLIILGSAIVCALFSKQAEIILASVKNYISHEFGWVYIFTVAIIFITMLILALSPLGNIRLGPDNSHPQYSFMSWMSMLFSAGMGIGLIYFGVAEPMQHYVDPAFPDTVNAAKDALLMSGFHWGIHAWCIYGILGLILAYFSYRYRLPLALNSALYPLLKGNINGWAGNAINVFALVGTFFGVATSLGFGAMQLDAGLQYLGFINDSFFYVALIIVVVMTCSVVSSISGVDKGVKILSNTNLIVMVLLMFAVLFMSPTVHLIESYSEGLGYYCSRFVDLTFNTRAFEPQGKTWYNEWTVYFWAWWIAWAPFVAMFIARISRGRTVREFILGVTLIPSLFVFLWMTIFGNGAIWVDQNVAGGALSAIAGNPDILLFKFFSYLPWSTLLTAVALISLAIFFVTSADSSIIVMNGISSRHGVKPPKWQNILWGVLMAGIAISLLSVGGLSTLQSVTLVAALPFAVVILLLIFCLCRAMLSDHAYHEAGYAYGSNNWDGKQWKERLSRILSLYNKADASNFITNIVLPAFEEVVEELNKNNVHAAIRRHKQKRPRLEIVIPHDNLRNFVYGVEIQPQHISESIIEEGNTPDDYDVNVAYVPVTYFGDGREGNNIQYLTKDEVIADIMREYERFIELASDDKHSLVLVEN